MTNWITDRPPTEADGDRDGEVRVRQNPSIEDEDVFLHWSYVGPGVPWKHNPLLTPLATAPEPQPAPEPVASDRPALAVGQTWRCRNGDPVTIVKNDGSDDLPFKTSNGYRYTINGFYWHDRLPHSQDLIELISEAPEPAPASPAPEPPATVATASEFPEVIRSGAAPFYVVATPDDSGGAGGGHLMAWEAQIPEGSTLQSALRRQAHIGHHYGTAYIAECRIIPLLTREVPAQQPQP